MSDERERATTGRASRRGSPGVRAAGLWRLLSGDEASGSGEQNRGGGWGDDELGELLARAWQAEDAAPPPEEPHETMPEAGWKVEAVPSEAEGGIAGLFTRVADPSVSGRELLSEMIEQLPDAPAPRVRPDDIEIERPVVEPPLVWFWGDDDIWPGRVATR